MPPTKSAPSLEPLLSVTDLAKLLQVDRRTIERLRASGRLPQPDVTVGRLPRWLPETYRTWIAAGGPNRSRRA